MLIELKNTKMLFLYRSFLFRFVKFETKDEKLKVIVDALNIKKRKDRIEYVYDEAIKYINKYYSEDLCKFENNQCIAQRNNNGYTNGCCRKCILVTDKGCPSVNLACKLIYCKTALGNIKLLKLSDIPVLKCLSLCQRVILKGSFFSTREEILKDLNYGLIYSSIRALKKVIQLDLYRLKNSL